MIAAIENAILARLRAASDAGALGYRFRTLETYPEDWDQYLKDKAVLNAPAAWTVFAGMRRTGGSPTASTWELTFGLVLMAENARSETATRQGGPDQAKEPGSYKLAEDALLLLAGNDLGLEIGGFEPRSVRVVARFPALLERKVSMLAVELATEVMLTAEDLPAGELPPFALFHANWDIEPFGNVDADPDAPGIQIPADASADATDDVHLETD